MISRTWIALGLAPLAVGCGPVEDEAHPFAEFDAIIERFLEDEGLDGATATVVHASEGVLHRQAYGEFDEDRISLVASSSKVLSAGVLMALHDQGLLDIDAPLSAVMGTDDTVKGDLTVAQLLSNSSGMVGLTDDAFYVPYLCQYIGSGTVTSCAQTIYTADDADDLVPPDTAFRYGGGPWQLAGGVAEVASGKSWDQLVDEIYTQPCGLTGTGYGNHYAQTLIDVPIDDEWEIVYPEFFDGDLNDLAQTDNANIEGGAYTTVADYEKILLMHLQGGLCGSERVMSAASVERMRADRIADAYDGSTFIDELAGYGFGWWIDRERAVVADGGAYGASPWLDLDRGYGAMILIEGDYIQGNEMRLATQPVLEAMFD